MVQYLFNENIIIYVFAGLLGLGLLIRSILDLVYIHLVKESDNLGGTKNKSLKHMKLKFETCYKLKIGVNNVDTFVDKNVLRYRFCGLLLSTWESLSGQILLLIFLIVPVSSVFGVIFDCGQDQILNVGGVGILSASILILVDKMINLPSKKQVLRLNLMDYLENFCKVRLEQETFHPELLEQYRKEYFHTAEANMQISATVVAQTKEEPKSELNRRREARRRKEEEKRAQILKREEEQKRIEQARKEEEKRKLEERKLLAAKRREEELLKLEEERAALELRKAEMKRKAEEKLQQNLLKQQKSEEKNKILRSIEEEFAAAKKSEENLLVSGMEEIAAEKEKTELAKAGADPVQKEPVKTMKAKSISPQEEKLIEDILKEFFA